MPTDKESWDSEEESEAVKRALESLKAQGIEPDAEGNWPVMRMGDGFVKEALRGVGRSAGAALAGFADAMPFSREVAKLSGTLGTYINPSREHIREVDPEHPPSKDPQGRVVQRSRPVDLRDKSFAERYGLVSQDYDQRYIGGLRRKYPISSGAGTFAGYATTAIAPQAVAAKGAAALPRVRTLASLSGKAPWRLPSVSSITQGAKNLVASPQGRAALASGAAVGVSQSPNLIDAEGQYIQGSAPAGAAGLALSTAGGSVVRPIAGALPKLTATGFGAKSLYDLSEAAFGDDPDGQKNYRLAVQAADTFSPLPALAGSMARKRLSRRGVELSEDLDRAQRSLENRYFLGKEEEARAVNEYVDGVRQRKRRESDAETRQRRLKEDELLSDRRSTIDESLREAGARKRELQQQHQDERLQARKDAIIAQQQDAKERMRARLKAKRNKELSQLEQRVVDAIVEVDALRSEGPAARGLLGKRAQEAYRAMSDYLAINNKPIEEDMPELGEAAELVRKIFNKNAPGKLDLSPERIAGELGARRSKADANWEKAELDLEALNRRIAEDPELDKEVEAFFNKTAGYFQSRLNEIDAQRARVRALREIDEEIAALRRDRDLVGAERSAVLSARRQSDAQDRVDRVGGGSAEDASRRAREEGLSEVADEFQTPTSARFGREPRTDSEGWGDFADPDPRFFRDIDLDSDQGTDTLPRLARMLEQRASEGDTGALADRRALAKSYSDSNWSADRSNLLPRNSPIRTLWELNKRVARLLNPLSRSEDSLDRALGRTELSSGETVYSSPMLAFVVNQRLKMMHDKAGPWIKGLLPLELGPGFSINQLSELLRANPELRGAWEKSGEEFETLLGGGGSLDIQEFEPEGGFLDVEMFDPNDYLDIEEFDPYGDEWK